MDPYQGVGLCPQGNGVGGHRHDGGGEVLHLSFRLTMRSRWNSEELMSSGQVVDNWLDPLGTRGTPRPIWR